MIIQLVLKISLKKIIENPEGNFRVFVKFF